MNRTFEEFLATQSANIPVWEFTVNLLLAVVLAFVLARMYVNYGRSLSNRRAFSRNLILITPTTMLIISIVKSSLALSLGLVGALSIVRFRTAIKEPEELAYLFLAIAIGLGLGADQRVVTLVGVAIIGTVIWITRRASRAETNQNLYLSVATNNQSKVDLPQIVRVLKDHCTEVSLRRFDDANGSLEATFVVAVEDFADLESVRESLRGIGDETQITFLDSKAPEG